MRLNKFIKIGNEIKKLRRSKGISQKEMAENILEIPRSTYSNYENNNRVPDNETLEKIAKALGVTVEKILNKTPNRYFQINTNIIRDKTYDIFEECFNNSYVQNVTKLTAKEFINKDKYFFKELEETINRIMLIKIENLKARIINKENAPILTGGYQLAVIYSGNLDKKDNKEKMRSFELGNKLNDKEYLEYMINKYQQYLDNLEKGLDNHNLPEENQ